MKDTDYAPRAAYFDTYLKGFDLIVCEIGVSAGAHAHAMLQYCPIAALYLVDPWIEANRYTEGYCRGRLLSNGFGGRVEFICKDSIKAAKSLPDNYFDGLYFDQRHEYEVVKEDLLNWWPKLKSGGVLGHRNYASSIPAIKNAVDEFVKENNITMEVREAEAILFKS